MSKETLDTPIRLKFDNGSSFPENSRIIGYTFLGVGILFLLLGTWYIGIPMLLLGAFISFTRYGVEFHPESKEATEYTNYLGFISIKKRTSYSNSGFISVIPLKISTRLYSKSVFSTTISDYYFTICLLSKNYRSKKELIRMDSKNSAETTAKALSHRLGLEYFEYDPQIIRDAFRK